MVLIIFKSENCSYAGDPPNIVLCTSTMLIEGYFTRVSFT